MSENIKIGIATVVFWFGYYWYKAFGKTPWYSYLSLRKLFYSSNTEFNKRLSERIARENPGYLIQNSVGVLGTLSSHDVEAIGNQIQRDGYFIFTTPLDEKTIDELVVMSQRTPARLVPKPVQGDEWGLFERGAERAIKYQYVEGDLVQDPIVQRLICDPGILAVSQAFLKAKPVLDLISMWWSTSISQNASSEVAQLYHFDMERIKFLKFFFYLTDVDTDTGPHCYIKGSNNGFASAVRRDGRILDEEMSKAYQPGDFIEITGKKGTILAVDTSGFHKGKNLKKGDRLLLQFEFSNSLFGINSDNHPVKKVTPEFQQAVAAYPFVYQRFQMTQ